MSVLVRTCDSVREAAQLLIREKGARLLAGGTLLMRALNEGDQKISSLVIANDPFLTDIRQLGSRVQIGACATMSAILSNRDLSFLHSAAQAIGGPAVRNMATVGGNLYAPRPYGDFATALLALDATVSIQSGYSAREMTLEQFIASSERQAGAFVTSVQLSRPAAPEAFRFSKISRVKPKGISVLSIAIHAGERLGRLSNVRVAYGAMAESTMRAKAVERTLEGRVLDDAAIAAAKAVACEGCSPRTDAIATDWYRREILPIHLGRTLAELRIKKAS
ncbi:MAG: FAD binding domain-containing protein [Hyphomicrobiaceae bacterium]